MPPVPPVRSDYVKAEGELGAELETMLKTFFDKMDDDKNGEVCSST